MATHADVVATRRKLGWIHDCPVDQARRRLSRQPLFTCSSPGPWQFSQPMASSVTGGSLYSPSLPNWG